MIKLLKYDWKRNATMTLAGLIILLMAQLVMTTVGWRNGWNPQGVIVLAFVIFLFSGFLVFLMACQTFNANMKAYSRRLLPLPTIYTIVSPIVLMFGLMFVLFLLGAAYDAVYAVLFDSKVSLIEAVTEMLTAREIAIAIGISVWASLFTTLVIFFSMAFSHLVEGKGGTFLGIIMCILLFISIPWVEDILFSSSGDGSQLVGPIHLTSPEVGSGDPVLTIGPATALDWLTFAFEVGVAIALIYGTIYLIDRKIKL